jgi:hypothetical protein
MSYIDTIIAQIPAMKSKERSSWRNKADAALKKSRDDADALRLLSSLDVFEAKQPDAASLHKTGDLAWERYVRGDETPFRAFHGDLVVGRIIKHATHTANRKQVYSVEILGKTLNGKWESISDARNAGEAAYSVMRSDRATACP